jgi:hypothetical protein
MAKRTGGFIGQDGINAPDPATGVTGTAGDEQVEVSFTSPLTLVARLLLVIECSLTMVHLVHLVLLRLLLSLAFNQRHKLHVQRMGDQSVWVV